MTLNVSTLAATLIDVAFTGGSVTGKTGFAATGVTTNDFWNTDNGVPSPNLKFVDGTASGVGLTLANLQGGDVSHADDSMYSNFLFTFAKDLTLTLTNLMPGTYEFYLYGHGAAPSDNSVFQLTASSKSYGSGATTTGSSWLSTAWQEGVQYVEFTNVSVASGQTVTIEVEPGAASCAVINGLQMGNFSGAMVTPMISGVAFSPNGSVTFNVAGLPYATARIWAATNLGPPVSWEPIFTNYGVGANGEWQYTDSNAVHFSERFYRFSSP